ncbi:MAG: HipA domain-containing protein [Deltaproteobacteria bacterium]|nr:HipA domain-containing protein [Candidatus Anaeroferrophillus wilburensis]MBN2887894.1 HipA domain-containing protein [Deltaproteobacteria bacterium]
MNRCPITYEPCEGLYSNKGLKLLSRQLTGLQALPFAAHELRQEAAARAGKMSIQGIQPKLSARLLVKEQRFDLVDLGGRYILKPQTADYPEIPENEDLTMRLAAKVGIEVPLHGLIYGKDRAMTYFIRRFDRTGRGKKYHVEDFAQLAGRTRDTKYRSSMEQIAQLIDTYCTFPAIEKLKLFRLTLFCFLVGNEDMHLKNFSLLRHNDIISLSPAYDLLNTTIALRRPVDELALPLNGKKNQLTYKDLINYFAKDRLKLATQVINKVLSVFAATEAEWHSLLHKSFLSSVMKEQYLRVLSERWARIFQRR